MKHLFVLIFFFSSLALAEAQTAYDFIQVSGEGEIKVKPDYVTLNVTVYSRAPSAQQAQKDNAKEMARLDKILRQDFKIEAKDLQTRVFQVSPNYEYVKERPIYKGISVNHTLSIKFHKTDEVGNLLDKLISTQNQENLGVRIEDIQFGSDQLKTYQLQALEQAMADAKSRAQTLSKAGGRNLLGVRKIADSRISTPEIEPVRSFGKAAFAMAQDVSPTQVAAGEITVRSQVTVEFEVK